MDTERLELREIYEVDHAVTSYISRSVFGLLTKQHCGVTKMSHFETS